VRAGRAIYLLTLSLVAVTVRAQNFPPVNILIDPNDATVRRTDSCGADPDCGAGSLTSNGLPDLLSFRIGAWQPGNPALDLQSGTYANAGQFLRLEMVINGHFNPAGPMVATFNPMRYGPAPLIGFVELDVDTNAFSGGNVDEPLWRYNGNVARFGALPAGREFINRVSTDGRDPDADYNTQPWIDRSGQDFELDLRGDEIVSIVVQTGDNDMAFEHGEVWEIHGRFFRRAQGYDTCAGGPYTPIVVLRFASVPVATGQMPTWKTEISLVYPLTQAAYAAANNEPPESPDNFDFNANSVEEALELLAASAGQNLCPAAYVYRPLIAPWAQQQAGDYLNPQRWRPTLLLGTVRPVAVTGSGNIVWSDVWPNVLAGDSNGDGFLTRTDASLVQHEVDIHDGVSGFDADGLVNGAIKLPNFGVWFSLYDINYDGFIDAFDRDFVQQNIGDYDVDGDVDLRDYQAFQACRARDNGSFAPSLRCRDGFDADENNRIEHADYTVFAAALNGPGGAP
jgi:hypothetical protein